MPCEFMPIVSERTAARSEFAGPAFLAFDYLSVQIVCPPLHHRCSLIQVLGVIVCSSHFVALQVSELQFNVLVREVVLMQDSGSQSAEAVAGHSALIAKMIQSEQNRIVAHRLVLIVRARKNKSSVPVNS